MDSSIFKVVFVGSTRVGKTSICIRLISGAFQLTAPTLGADFMQHKIVTRSKRVINTRIFDTSGQDRFFGLSKSFFRGANVSVFVLSFDEVESLEKLEKYVETVEDNCEDCLHYLVLNKSDLAGAKEGDLGISLEDVEKTRSKYGFEKVYVTSAKTGEGIEELFLDIGDDLEKELAEPIPAPTASTKLIADEREEEKGCGCCNL
ncbi:Small GTPase like protein [Aduncisulcus paluster]|uniref:Small GTPase like protein n=1 Tax=Aduncisulcus paluster TaxID=2918883 RepID=A0ABQ5JV90_9EUKA|nr:Small GTPase like protein [Aduncisulcus paluster]|eukprot:gnl/Carplike_NY0171/1990_a2684_900.p1 GENE.gnl/Carplike_NY0171/1990_a2684_900~~gnl/Carplike_NY0171/1990_a2684_900.p1  ORF type:complete len:204 (+),score=52.53 gnl/Carplike_NY0171/1990_a2684_900:125-736(+)